MSKLQVFLSHTSSDKEFVRRFHGDLKDHGFEAWLDEKDVPFGKSITQEVQKGLKSADVTFVFLSERALISKWVAAEWEAQYFRQMAGKETIVVPIRLDNSEMPIFLEGRRYIDFRNRSQYEDKLSETLEFLSVLSSQRFGTKSPAFSRDQGVLAHVREILADLEGENISLPFYEHVPIIKTLKEMPRSGKRIRLVKFQPKIRPRSVFDHILSLAHLADVLLPHINHGISSHLGDLSLCIAYHELNEVVLGDIPSYTSIDNKDRHFLRVYAEERLRNVQPAQREEIANKFIWMFLSDKHKQALSATMMIFKRKKNRKVVSLFRALDKIDPIFAVWRYLHHYRGQLGDAPRDFNIEMKDFFENPDVRNFMKENRIDGRLVEAVIFLQDRKNAWNYYEDPAKVFGDNSLFRISSAAVKSAIEGIPLFSDEPISDA